MCIDGFLQWDGRGGKGLPIVKENKEKKSGRNDQHSQFRWGIQKGGRRKGMKGSDQL